MNEVRYFKCVKQLRAENFFTEGKVYEFTDEEFISNRGYNYIGMSCPNIESVIKFLKEWYEFKEIKVEEKKEMNKFKVGDMVKGTERGSQYSFTDKNMTKGQVIKVLGEDRIEVKIIERNDNSRIGYEYEVKSELFDLITPHKKSIHLTFDGNTTHAIVKEDGKIVKREKVGLFKGDVYDEATGVREVIDKLYGKKVVEDVKPKFVKAKVGDTIKIVKSGVRHNPRIKIGDTFIVTSVNKDFVESKYNGFFDRDEEYIILNDKSKLISEYTTDELLSEIKRRMEE